MQLLRVSEAAKRLAVSRSMVYKLIYQGELQSVKVGSIYRIPESSIAKFIETRLSTPDAA